MTEDDLWDWENNSVIDHLQMLQNMMRYWNPQPKELSMHKDRVSLVGQLSMVALLRAQRKYDEALELSLSLVRQDPIGVRPRIAVSLCLLDTGEWHDAKSVLDELIKIEEYFFWITPPITWAIVIFFALNKMKFFEVM